MQEGGGECDGVVGLFEKWINLFVVFCLCTIKRKDSLIVPSLSFILAPKSLINFPRASILIVMDHSYKESSSDETGSLEKEETKRREEIGLSGPRCWPRPWLIIIWVCDVGVRRGLKKEREKEKMSWFETKKQVLFLSFFQTWQNICESREQSQHFTLPSFPSFHPILKLPITLLTYTFCGQIQS